MELISVIVPVYNVELYLCRCVESIQNQTYTNLEIILVDDGSPDNCPKICDELKANDKRIKVIHKHNEGLGLTRNAGLLLATGDYVTFVDSDDWIDETHIENLYNALKLNDADVALGRHTRVTSDGVMVKKDFSLAEGLYKGKDVFERILLPLIGPKPEDFRDVQISSSVAMNLYKMSIIRENQISFVSERLVVAEDTFFNIDFLFYANTAVCIEEYGYFYFQNANSICESYNPKRFERTLRYYKEMYNKAERYGFHENVQYRIERSFLMKSRVAIRHIVLSEMTPKNKIEQIVEILGNDVMKSVLADYPIHKFIPSMRLMVQMMKNQNAYGVYLLMWLREQGRHINFVKNILRIIGIGRI